MKRIAAILLLISLCGCTTYGGQSRYEGTDGGYLITSLSATKNTDYNGYGLFYRRRGDKQNAGRIWWGQHNDFDARALDFSSDKETGIVDVQRLPPGDYEIYNFDLHLNQVYWQKHFWAKKDFSIPFTIRAGRSAYVGAFLAARITGKNIFGMTIPNGAYFVLTDEAQRDVPIARKKQPAIRDVDDETVKPESVGSPLIRSKLE